MKTNNPKNRKNSEQKKWVFLIQEVKYSKVTEFLKSSHNNNRTNTKNSAHKDFLCFQPCKTGRKVNRKSDL